MPHNIKVVGKPRIIGMTGRDENIAQCHVASCAIRCQEIILRDYGFCATEDELCSVAKGNGWYDEAIGTLMSDNGKLLMGFGVEFHHSQHNTVDDIAKELKSSHRVMVNINLCKLMGRNTPSSHKDANHAVLVEGIEMRKYTEKAVNVIITNPSDGMVRKPYDIKCFEEAWSDSCCYMLATDSPAEFEYDAQTKQMISLTQEKRP